MKLADKPNLTITNAALDLIGGNSYIAKRLDISDATVSKWRVRGISPGFLFKVLGLAKERKIALTAYDLRPDLF